MGEILSVSSHIPDFQTDLRRIADVMKGSGLEWIQDLPTRAFIIEFWRAEERWELPDPKAATTKLLN